MLEDFFLLSLLSIATQYWISLPASREILKCFLSGDILFSYSVNEELVHVI